LGIIVWWLLALGVIAGVVGLRLSRTGWVAVSGLTALMVLEVASSIWSHDAQAAVGEFDRILVYLGVVLLTIAVASRSGLDVVTDGLALGISAVAGVSLLSRCVPELHLERGSAVFGAVSANRLSYPLDYWNGLGALVAIAIPLLLRRAAEPSRPFVRAMAVAPLPTIAGVLYLTSSRGGIAVAFVAILTFVVLTSRRWRALGALAAGGAPAAVGIAVLIRSPQLANGPLTSVDARSQGHTAAFVFLAMTFLAVGAQALLIVMERRLPQQAPRLGLGLCAAVIAAALVGIVAVHPVRVVERFTARPTHFDTSHGYVFGHIFSLNGSGRWQQWSAAVSEWKTHPVLGGGAGSYYYWWLRHGSLPLQVRNAHSLYLETLAELGLVGLVSLLTAFLAALAAGTGALRRGPPERRTQVAAIFAATAATFVALGIDWFWQLAALGAVSMCLLGLLLVAGAETDPSAPSSWTRRGLWVTAGVAAIIALSGALLAERYLERSRGAAGASDLRLALASARTARDLEPWSAGVYLQLALVEEQMGRLEPAHREIERAITRNRADWSLWLVDSRIRLELGETGAARRSLRHAASLNPNSALFGGLAPPPP
jgi:hypothetical protein